MAVALVKDKSLDPVKIGSIGNVSIATGAQISAQLEPPGSKNAHTEKSNCELKL
jgi:hypothetical protein